LDSLILTKTVNALSYNFDLLIIDEAQDLRNLLYRSIIYLLKFNSTIRNNVKVSVLGDKNQNIYKYQDSDSRYLTHAYELFNFNKWNWVLCTLSVSYRLTQNMADLVNYAVLQEDRIRTANKERTKNV